MLDIEERDTDIEDDGEYLCPKAGEEAFDLAAEGAKHSLKSDFERYMPYAHFVWMTLQEIQNAADNYVPIELRNEKMAAIFESEEARMKWVPDRSYSFEELMLMDSIKKQIYHGKVIKSFCKNYRKIN